jgi:Protein of unknown function (DUF1236)
MKKVAATVFTVLLAGAAFAQDSRPSPRDQAPTAPAYQQGSGHRAGGPASELNSPTGMPATTGAIAIAPEVRTRVRQHVTTTRPRAATVPSGFAVTTGAVLPETVEVQAFPADVGITGYRYTVIGDRTVLVDSGRRIVDVIE